MNHQNSAVSKLNDEYVLSPEQIRQYRDNGHVYLPQVADAETAAAFERIITEWVMKLNQQDKPLSERDTYGKAFIQVGNLWEHSEEIQRFVLARRFAKIAADLMGVDGVRIYHDQALYKEPGGGHTPWHQDQIYWPLDNDNSITMWMPLEPIPAEMGTMTFASGTHRLGFVSRAVISDESHRTLGEFISAKQFPLVNYGAMAAGDATFHSGWTIHSAPGNPTDRMRKVMTVIYIADGTRVAEPDSRARNNDMLRWFPGCKPGDPAASPLNPLVYKRG